MRSGAVAAVNVGRNNAIGTPKERWSSADRTYEVWWKCVKGALEVLKRHCIVSISLQQTRCADAKRRVECPRKFRQKCIGGAVDMQWW